MQYKPKSIDRLPPHSNEAEQGVLACLMMDPQLIGEAIERFSVGGEAFYELKHRQIYDALVSMYDQQLPIDMVTLCQKFKNSGKLEEVGGMAFIASLPDTIPSAANFSFYADILLEKYTRRRLIQVGAELVNIGFDEGDASSADLLDRAERLVLEIGKSLQQKELPEMRELVQRTITKIEEYQRNKGVIDGIPTGFSDIDRLTTGLKGGDMVVVAARPSVGKSSLAMNIVDYVSVERKMPVGVFSLEMSNDSLAFRLLCSRARVNIRDIQAGDLFERDFPKLTSAAAKLAGAGIYIDDTAGLSILQLRSRARRMAQKYGIKLLVIDYLQLLHVSGRKVDSRQQEVSLISTGIKEVAKELGIPVIVLSQLNRELEKDKNRKPRLSDLRESGSIEQDADLVAMLYRPAPEVKDDEDGEPVEDENTMDTIPVNLLVAKQRNGPTGEVYLTFFKGYTRFEQAAKVDDEDIPDPGRYSE